MCVWNNQFQTVDHHVLMPTEAGGMISAPLQVSIYTDADRNHDNIGRMVGQASYGIIKDVRRGDVLVVASDGLFDNVSNAMISTSKL